MPLRRHPILAVGLVLALGVLACGTPGQPNQQTVVALTVEARPARTQTPAPDTPAGPPETQAPPSVLPTFTPVTPATLAPPSVTPVQTPCDRAAFVTDVTVPDGADFHSGDAFTKTWRLSNNGTCTWTSGYSLIFDHGDAMGAPASQQLTTGTVAPGQSIDVSVNLTAPSAVGTYRGYFLLRNPSGVVFGIGVNADVAFWAEIEVVPISVTLMPFFPIVTRVFLLYQASGTGEVVDDGQCFDLDTGSGAACLNAAADFQYEATFFSRSFDPLHSASVGLFGGSQPSKSDCQTGGLSTGTINLSLATYYCYQTGDGRWGWLVPTELTINHMTFDWATYR